MWPFNKRAFHPAEFAPGEDKWGVGWGNFDGQPIIVRVNQSAKRNSRHRGLSIRVGVAIPLHKPDERGYPNDEEALQLRAIEDRLDSVIEPAGKLVLVITCGGMREFVSYVRSTEAADRAVAQLRETTATHEVQHYVEEDPNWKVYDDFAF